MLEQIGDIWELSKSIRGDNPVVITTNGFVKASGQLVMGRGIAQQARDRYPGLDFRLGERVRATGGNRVHLLWEGNPRRAIISFPVKPAEQFCTGSNVVQHMASQFKPGDRVPGWACKAEPVLIERSLQQLAAIACNVDQSDRIFCPRFGCGAGELSWIQIAPLAQKYLSDFFVICSYR